MAGRLTSKAERSEGTTRKSKAGEGRRVGRGFGSDLLLAIRLLGGIREGRGVKQ